jgi:hypothetical protein
MSHMNTAQQHPDGRRSPVSFRGHVFKLMNPSNSTIAVLSHTYSLISAGSL